MDKPSNRWLTRLPSILVLTLCAGENELQRSQHALERQTYRFWESKIFQNLSNMEAHRALYRTVERDATKYDLFIKLDADMVFSGERALELIVEEFVRDQSLDHAVFSVSDWYSGMEVMGLHAYSNRARWSWFGESLFVDPDPMVPGKRKLFWQYPAPVAAHSPDPSVQQAYLFGAHRALKVVQRGQQPKKPTQAQFQLGLLREVWKGFLATGEIRRGVAVFGAEDIFRGNNAVLENKADAVWNESITRIDALGKEGIQSVLAASWGGLSLRYVGRRIRYVGYPKWAIRTIGIPRKIRRLSTRITSHV